MHHLSFHLVEKVFAQVETFQPRLKPKKRLQKLTKKKNVIYGPPQLFDIYWCLVTPCVQKGFPPPNAKVSILSVATKKYNTGRLRSDTAQLDTELNLIVRSVRINRYEISDRHFSYLLDDKIIVCYQVPNLQQQTLQNKGLISLRRILAISYVGQHSGENRWRLTIIPVLLKPP